MGQILTMDLTPDMLPYSKYIYIYEKNVISVKLVFHTNGTPKR